VSLCSDLNRHVLSLLTALIRASKPCGTTPMIQSLARSRLIQSAAKHSRNSIVITRTHRRFLLQRRTEERRKGNGQSLSPMVGTNTADGIGRAPRGINDGKGFVFISHLGEVFPSGFLPVSAGNVRKQSLAELYRHSPLFVSLRDSTNLKGKCCICEFRRSAADRGHELTP